MLSHVEPETHFAGAIWGDCCEERLKRQGIWEGLAASHRNSLGQKLRNSRAVGCMTRKFTVTLNTARILVEKTHLGTLGLGAQSGAM